MAKREVVTRFDEGQKDPETETFMFERPRVTTPDPDVAVTA